MSSCDRPLLPVLQAPRDHASRLLTAIALMGSIVLAAAPAQAQYKVVGPDGKVTYTDRAPTGSAANVTSLGSRPTQQAPEPELPFELRQMASRYPVTLYVASGACEPCNSGRQMLKQRGIPFSERLVKTAEDGEAFEKLTGAREAPTLKVGSQVLRGFAAETWNAYLDAAGYPRTSQLPANYEYAAAHPLVEQRAGGTTKPDARPQAPRPAATTPTAVAPPSGSIRF